MTDAPILIAALVITTIWGIYLFPSLFRGRRTAPLSSTEEFDRWTHVMADVQRRSYSARRSTARVAVRIRRRRALVALVGLAVATVVMALLTKSVMWLVVHLLFDAGLAWYVGMLLQLRHHHDEQVAAEHMADRPSDADQPQVKIVAH